MNDERGYYVFSAAAKAVDWILDIDCGLSLIEKSTGSIEFLFSLPSQMVQEEEMTHHPQAIEKAKVNYIHIEEYIAYDMIKSSGKMYCEELLNYYQDQYTPPWLVNLLGEGTDTGAHYSNSMPSYRLINSLLLSLKWQLYVEFMLNE